MTGRHFTYEPGWSALALAAQIKALPGVRTEYISTGSSWTIDLDARRHDTTPNIVQRYPLTESIGRLVDIAMGNVWVTQTLHALFITPDKQPHTLLEVNTYAPGDATKRRWMLLGELCSTERPEVADLLLPARTTELVGPPEGTWRTGIHLSPDSRHVAFMHQGVDVVQLVGSLSPVSQMETTIDPSVWAPRTMEVYHRIGALAGRPAYSGQ